MDSDTIHILLASYDGTRILTADGDVFAVHDPDGDLPPQRQIPWATLVHSDAHDTASDLGRPGVFRLNLGLAPQRRDEVVEPGAEHDLTALDVVMPHPVYGRQGWVCVLNPDASWPLVRGLVDAAHDRAAGRG